MKSQATAMQILEKVKAALVSRGTSTIAGLSRAFRHMDSFDGNRKCDP